uniref:Uncharacterized protein n=1 Tax=Arundo donax TaxID=35708 RepID=A0A0A9A2G3_ARUDO
MLFWASKFTTRTTLHVQNYMILSLKKLHNTSALLVKSPLDIIIEQLVQASPKERKRRTIEEQVPNHYLRFTF